MSFDNVNPSDGANDAASAPAPFNGTVVGPCSSVLGAEAREPVEAGASGTLAPDEPPHDADEVAAESMDLPLKQHYVYVLIDPRDDGVFYVGKGQNGRVEDHAKVARNDPSESTKDERIRAIHAAGDEVRGRVVGRFDTEAEAFAVEAVLIHWMYGRRTREKGPLTNIQAGHGHLHIRRRGDLGVSRGLDVSVSIKMERGGYVAAELQKLMTAGIPDKALDVLARVRDGLAQRGIELNFDEPRVVEYGRWIASDATLQQDVLLRLQFSSIGLITNLRAASEGTKKSREIFTRAIEQRSLQPIGNGRYTWLSNWRNNRLQFDDTESILGRIEAAYELFRPRQTDPAAATST